MADTNSVIGGVDTHADTHHAAILDYRGQLLDTAVFPATGQGYRQLLAWMRRRGTVDQVGVEGTGSYGAGLTRYLQAEGVTVIEVNRSHQQLRRQRGKTDPIDAEAAARMMLAGHAAAVPKERTGIVEAIRVLRAARAGAIKARTAAVNQLKDLRTTAPEPLRASLRGRSLLQTAHHCARLRPDTAPVHDPIQATKAALQAVARRIMVLTEEITQASRQLQTLVAQAAPRTTALLGVATHHGTGQPCSVDGSVVHPGDLSSQHGVLVPRRS